MELITQYLDKEVAKLGLVLVLSLLMGLERESVGAEKRTFFFGGIRTYPLFALSAYLLSIISPSSMIPFSIGFVILGIFLAQSYYYKLDKDKLGFTTEMAAVITYVLGALVAKDYYWLAASVTIIVMILLQMKTTLENMAQKIRTEELFTFVKFLLLTAVILPIIPNVNISPFSINPFKTWLIVVAVSGISYGSYLLQKAVKKGRSVVLTAIIGAIYSSTVITVVLAKKARGEGMANLFSGSILMASGIMYLRIAALLYLFSQSLFRLLVLPFLALFGLATIAGLLYITLTRKREERHEGPELEGEGKTKNPLELTTAVSFAFLFIIILVVTALVSQYFGQVGIYLLSLIMGVTDVDPFILGLTQAEDQTILTSIAARSIIIATASNNVAKGMYALVYADRKTGRQSLLGLSLLSLISLLSLLLV